MVQLVLVISMARQSSWQSLKGEIPAIKHDQPAIFYLCHDAFLFSCDQAVVTVN